MIRICQNLSEFFYENLLTMWAKYAIYGAIDKIPEICSMCLYAPKENLTLRRIIWCNIITHMYICR